jgi:hypothetical protein
VVVENSIHIEPESHDRIWGVAYPWVRQTAPNSIKQH